MTDEELLLQYRTGDALAFTQLVEAHGDQLYAFVQNQLRDEAQAADIAQETWIKLILNLDMICRRIERDGNAFRLKGYIYTIAANLVRDYWRRTNRLTPLGDGEELLESDALPPTRLLSREELLNCVALRLSGLNLKKQQAFWRTRDGRMTYAELASELRVATETVKDWVRQALRAIRPCREEFDGY